MTELSAQILGRPDGPPLEAPVDNLPSRALNLDGAFDDSNELHRPTKASDEVAPSIGASHLIPTPQHGRRQPYQAACREGEVGSEGADLAADCDQNCDSHNSLSAKGDFAGNLGGTAEAALSASSDLTFERMKRGLLRLWPLAFGIPGFRSDEGLARFEAPEDLSPDQVDEIVGDVERSMKLRDRRLSELLQSLARAKATVSDLEIQLLEANKASKQLTSPVEHKNAATNTVEEDNLNGEQDCSKTATQETSPPSPSNLTTTTTMAERDGSEAGFEAQQVPEPVDLPMPTPGSLSASVTGPQGFSGTGDMSVTGAVAGAGTGEATTVASPSSADGASTSPIQSPVTTTRETPVASAIDEETLQKSGDQPEEDPQLSSAGRAAPQEGASGVEVSSGEDTYREFTTRKEEGNSMAASSETAVPADPALETKPLDAAAQTVTMPTTPPPFAHRLLPDSSFYSTPEPSTAAQNTIQPAASGPPNAAHKSSNSTSNTSTLQATESEEVIDVDSHCDQATQAVHAMAAMVAARLSSTSPGPESEASATAMGISASRPPITAAATVAAATMGNGCSTANKSQSSSNNNSINNNNNNNNNNTT
eukprot:CAMPEP_0206450654 /NCGR_PEP_ID=MMETSP0324_2-20121206/18862_1 /ASSEMBLY_ACC=CAM_ASM_000836 /TAXON_ID=2866 /ORGANISM="Crypthecodinium cohnii, Strain Seligo" /LENGTH=594 /DNA_ID=CAMNT_0053920361 /DNA_START=23 /DNA_END=1803 /DNA_ORIENTATION=-